VTSATNARNKTTTFEFDDTGLLTRVTEPGGIETVFAYDDAGLLETRTNDRGAVETHAYDPLGRPTTLTDPASNDWLTSYDADGRIATTTDGEGQVTTYHYDDGGRLVELEPDSGPSITYTYSDAGRLSAMTDGNGTTEYGYDPVGRLTSTERGGRITTYGYDDAGRLAAVTYPGGAGTVEYDYDAAGRLETLTDWDERVTSYTYDAAGLLETETRPGDLVTTYTYDDLGRPATVTSTVDATEVLELGYAYDPNGNLASYTDDSGSATFTYDDLDRLTAADYPGADDFAYAYDTVGNVTSIDTPAESLTFSYDLADRITSEGPGPSPAAPAYDANGDLTSDGSYGGRTYSYDPLRRLVGVSGAGHSAAYELDGAGNRWSQTVDSVTTAFDLDLSAVDPTILVDGTRVYLPADPGAGSEQSGSWTSTLVDHLGTSLLTVSEAGSVGSARAVGPYGLDRDGSVLDPGIGYTGEWSDASGLVNLRARAYDPRLARFTGRDTVGGVLSAPQTANRSSYALNNPFRYTDPGGRFIQAAMA
jgi:RHS repeat-associated protein